MKEKYDQTGKDEKTRIRQALPVIIVLVVLDQLTKLWALNDLRRNGLIPIWKGVLELLYVENRGAAFGILQNRQWFFWQESCGSCTGFREQDVFCR